MSAFLQRLPYQGSCQTQGGKPFKACRSQQSWDCHVKIKDFDMAPQRLTEGWLEFLSGQKSAFNSCCIIPATPQSRPAVPQENLRFPCGSLPCGQTSNPKGLLPWPSQPLTPLIGEPSAEPAFLVKSGFGEEAVKPRSQAFPSRRSLRFRGRWHGRRP